MPPSTAVWLPSAARLWTAVALLLLAATTQPIRFCAAKISQASTALCNAFSGGLCGTSLVSSDSGNCVLLRVDAPPAAPRIRMKCWGWGGRGMNGIGPADYTDNGDGSGFWNNRGDDPDEMGENLPFVDMGMGHEGDGSGVAQMSKTGRNVCAIDGSTRELKCFGDPYKLDQLGGSCRVSNCHGTASCKSCCCLGSKMRAVNLGTSLRAIQVAAGGMQTCAIVENQLTLARGLKCFGRGGYIGLGDSEDRGNSGHEMGDALPFVSLGTGRHPVQVASGHTHTCVLLDNGDVKCFGSNSNQALGLPYDSANPTMGDQPGEMGDDLPSVDLGEGRTAVQICANGGFGCAIDDQANLRCWGNHPGRDSSRDPALVSVGSGTGAVVQIACGAYNAYHMCAVFADGRVKCWGSNGGGQLGLGDTNSRGQGTSWNMGDGLPYVDLGTGRTALQVSAGSSHSCALLDNLQVKCWGSGNFGQLGYGDILSRGKVLGEMGDQLPYVNLTGNAPGVTLVSHVNIPWSAIFPPPPPPPPPSPPPPPTPPPPSPPPPPTPSPPPPSSPPPPPPSSPPPPPPSAPPPPPPSSQGLSQGEEQTAPAPPSPESSESSSNSSDGPLSVGGAGALGFVSGGLLCGILVAVVMHRYRGRDAAGHGLPMEIKTKLVKPPKKPGKTKAHNEAEMTARNAMTTLNPLGI